MHGENFSSFIFPHSHGGKFSSCNFFKFYFVLTMVGWTKFLSSENFRLSGYTCCYYSAYAYIVHKFGPSLCCCINFHIQRDVQALARRYGGRLASCFNGSTSHVIVSADENGLCSRTVKYLQGLATGRWIVSHQCKLTFWEKSVNL